MLAQNLSVARPISSFPVSLSGGQPSQDRLRTLNGDPGRQAPVPAFNDHSFGRADAIFAAPRL
jgi:hypothetical protein